MVSCGRSGHPRARWTSSKVPALPLLTLIGPHEFLSPMDIMGIQWPPPPPPPHLFLHPKHRWLVLQCRTLPWISNWSVLEFTFWGSECKILSAGILSVGGSQLGQAYVFVQPSSTQYQRMQFQHKACFQSLRSFRVMDHQVTRRQPGGTERMRSGMHPLVRPIWAGLWSTRAQLQRLSCTYFVWQSGCQAS